MKSFFAIVLLASALFSNAQASEGTTGQYVCSEPVIDSAAVAAALNALGCDTTKPFTVNFVAGASLAMVCCVSN